MPAADDGHFLAALHFDSRLGDIRGGRVRWLSEHVVLDFGIPGADATGAALQAQLEWGLSFRELIFNMSN